MIKKSLCFTSLIFFLSFLSLISFSIVTHAQSGNSKSIYLQKAHSQSTQSRTINMEIKVCPNCEVNSLDEAVDKINPGGTIRIQGGHYNDVHLMVRKPMKLLGEGEVILDGSGKYQVITVVKADNVEIQNLKIQNTGVSFTEELAGIRVIESQNCKVIGNTIENTTYAVYLEKSENCWIENNKIHSQAKDETSSGNGIHIWTGLNHHIINNKISGHRDGIYLEFVKTSIILRNQVDHNLRYGLHFMSSHETTYDENIFSDNGAGVAVMYSHKIKMHKNTFSKNSGAAAYGLLLKEIVDSEVLNNTFSQNTVGIYMEGSNRTQFSFNQFTDNGFALKIMGDCENNEFKNNNFIDNTFEVTTNADHNWNLFSNNYWSQYDGFDINKDNIGDHPYRPVSLSSIILERVDSSYILLNSFFFQLLDQIERVLPEMIPEQLKDEAPLMKPVEIQ